jgi:ribosomal protein S18 acetylase RimI-like enzyme
MVQTSKVSETFEVFTVLLRFSFRTTSMDIKPITKEQCAEAAALFVARYQQLRTIYPILPDRMADPARVSGMIERLVANRGGVAAWEQGRLVGYLSWVYYDSFRGTARRGAYCPEWAHACTGANRPAIYRALYATAARQWAADGCQVHSITLLANDPEAQEVWFWNGFGLLLADGIRPMKPLGVSYNTGLTIRKATPEDAEALCVLDAEHCRHYSTSPIFMTPRHGASADGFREFIAKERNSVWLAEDGDTPAGFIRYDGYDFDCADILASDQGAFISGAYVRPAYRGRKVAVALLDSALRDYSARGFSNMVLDFETFNPNAATFWPRYFDLACYPLMRVPESLGLHH